MTYIIAAAGKDSCDELIKILKDYITMIFQDSYATLKAAEACIRERPPDMAFIWLDMAELNDFKLAREIKEQNPFSKVVFVSSQRESAVEAFEYEADGFLLMPFDKEKIGQLLQRSTKKEEMKN